MNKRIILASKSPRRQEILRQIGLAFIIDPADVDERVLPGEAAEKYAVRVAADKARIAAARTPEPALIIAADTLVTLDRVILGKPTDPQDAQFMLSMLSGRMHRVITGLAVMNTATGKMLTDAAVTSVWFRQLTPADIAAYVRSGEPLDKAGAYGIQGKGALLVDRIDGCYFNVVGLPLSLLGQMLREFGLSLL